MKEFLAGTYILHKGYKPFVPSFINEDIDWKLEELSSLLQDASLWLGKLNSYADLIPDIDFFIKMYATKEATNSNRIEGTRTTFEDAISPVEQVKPELRDDWHEVQNYIQAINYSVEKLNELPISMRLLKEAHKILLQGVRGEHKTPGEIRKTQNWIGGSSLQDAFFIPPEPNLLPKLLSDIEKFLHNEYLQVPELIRVGIAHYQFETVHPFLDGNGRTGRLLIILYLISAGLLNKPVLYISDFFERNRMSYYDSLSMVKQNDNITQWLKFFLNGVIETSKNSIKTFEEIIKLKKEKDICILAHCYQSPEILEVADFVGDSFALSVEASKVSNKTVIMCGVRFMAETVKILSPDKTVYLANPDAGCPMAEMMDKEVISLVKEQYPDYTVVAYINTTSELKTICDVCVTSSSALKICKQIENDNILFIPDCNLGDWISKQLPEKNFKLLSGGCPTHARMGERDVEKARKAHPNALLLVHPECVPDVVGHADYVGSTTGIMNFAKQSDAKEFIIGTENSIVTHLQMSCPDKMFYPLSKDCVCHNMKATTLVDVLNCCKGVFGEEITLDEETYIGAKKCIDEMIRLG